MKSILTRPLKWLKDLVAKLKEIDSIIRQISR
jgi:hypothetical protein